MKAAAVAVALMAGAAGGALAQADTIGGHRLVNPAVTSTTPYVYSIEGIPAPSGANRVSVFIGARGADDVRINMLAYNSDGEDGQRGDREGNRIPGNGFLRLDGDDLMLGLESGARKVVIWAEALINVSAMRTIWGDHAVSLPVHHWEEGSGTRPPGTAFRDCPECPEVIIVPGGSFMMGSESGWSNERPVHQVTIGRSFAVGVYEVTYDEWDACVSDEVCERWSVRQLFRRGAVIR